MWSEIIIDPDSFVYFSFSMFLIGEMVGEVKLILESSINSFSDSIFIRVVFGSHADVNVVTLKSIGIIGATIL